MKKQQQQKTKNTWNDAASIGLSVLRLNISQVKEIKNQKTELKMSLEQLYY